MQTLIILKPDAFDRKLVGYCIADVEAQGDIKDLTRRWPPYALWEEHYAEHKGKDFYDGLMEHMSSGPVIVIRADVRSLTHMRTSVMQVRRMMGCDGPKNLMHCSDSPEAAARELALWFG